MNGQEIATNQPERKPRRSAKLARGEELVKIVNRRLCKRHGLPPGAVTSDPLEFCLTLVAGFWPDDIVMRQKVGGEQTDPLSDGPDVDTRIEAAKIAIRYVRPQLAATEVSGPGGGPIAVAGATIDIGDMMKFPDLRKKVEDLQLEMARLKRSAEQPKQLEASGTLLPGAQDILDAELVPAEPAQENQNGPTLD